jgi:hypothetical protein
VSKTVYVYAPVGLDKFDPKDHQPKAGDRVVKCGKRRETMGCPPNGAMGFCYVEDAETGEFYGMVLLGSLQKEKA